MSKRGRGRSTGRDQEGPTSTTGAPGKVQRRGSLTPVQRRYGIGTAARSAGAPTPIQLDRIAPRPPSQQTSADAHGIRAEAESGASGTGSALPHLDAIQASFGGHDVTGVKAHVGGGAAAAAESIGAEAYAIGNDVAFRSTPDLHTAAHEAAHVVQQRAGLKLPGGVGAAGDAHERHADAVADRVVQGKSSEDLLGEYHGSAPGPALVQMRRLPANVEALMTDPSDPDAAAPNFDASAEGMVLLLQRAAAELTPEQLRQVVGTIRGSLSWGEFFRLPPNQMLTRASNALLAVRADLAHGDPNLIDTGPRPATDDRANLATLVRNAQDIFDAIIGGSHDASVAQVFGAANVTAAKAKYRRGCQWMLALARRDQLVTDRSGYSEEVSLGGLTAFQQQISLAPARIDNPDEPSSIITMIHESMHAGNSDVTDRGYIHQPSFTELAEDVKLTNAAHFEVVPRRILGTSYSFDGQTFVPAGTTVGGVSAPPLTATEQAIRATSEAFRVAWTIGLNLHSLLLNVYKQPSEWSRRALGGTYRGGLSYWSKVEKLTIHRKTDIDPASPSAARHPVSQIDMALSEGLVRKLSLAMRAVPRNEAAADTLERANATDDERTAAHGSVDDHRDFLITLVLEQGGVRPITGAVERDFRVVHELVNATWSNILRDRSPDEFPD
jgi:hypothetical protein